MTVDELIVDLLDKVPDLSVKVFIASDTAGEYLSGTLGEVTILPDGSVCLCSKEKE